MAKVPTSWNSNPSAEANRKTYDSSVTTYNSVTVTYSSIVSGDQADTEKIPTQWSEA